MSVQKMDLDLIYGMQIRNIIFYCTNSIRCLMTEEGSNLLTCPLTGGREKCEVWHLREKLESEAQVFWDYIKVIFSEIAEKDLIYPELMKLEQEQRHFLSLTFLGIGKYFAANGFQLPKSWGVTRRILMEFQENPVLFFQKAIEDLWQDSQFTKMLFYDFRNTLLSPKSQKGIIILLYLFKKAIEEASKPIPLGETEELIKEILKNLRSHQE